jgi:hypothetical protein
MLFEQGGLRRSHAPEALQEQAEVVVHPRALGKSGRGIGYMYYRTSDAAKDQIPGLLKYCKRLRFSRPTGQNDRDSGGPQAPGDFPGTILGHTPSLTSTSSSTSRFGSSIVTARGSPSA